MRRVASLAILTFTSLVGFSSGAGAQVVFTRAATEVAVDELEADHALQTCSYTAPGSATQNPQLPGCFGSISLAGQDTSASASESIDAPSQTASMSGSAIGFNPKASDPNTAAFSESDFAFNVTEPTTFTLRVNATYQGGAVVGVNFPGASLSTGGVLNAQSPNPYVISATFMPSQGLEDIGIELVSGPGQMVTATATLTWTSASTPQALTITPTALPPGQAYSATAVGVQYSTQLTATGGTPPYINWTASGLPPGLSVNPTTGLISGSISSPVPDTYSSINVGVSDSAGNSAPAVALTLATYCGNPNSSPPGDDRDALIDEYQTNLLGVPVFLNTGRPPFPGSKFQLPHCDQITSHSFQTLNVGSPGCPATPQTPLIVADEFPLALANWQIAIGRNGLNSAYRSPDDQACAGGAKPATRSQHMFGDAADLPSIGKTTTACQQFTPVAQQDATCKDIHRMDKRALGSGFTWTETWQPTSYPCQPGNAKFVDVSTQTCAARHQDT